MGDSDYSTQRTMSKGTKTKKQQTKAKLVMVEGGMKQAASEGFANDKGGGGPTESFLNVGNGEESEKPHSELKESDYEKEEESVEEEGKGGEKDGGDSVEQMETTKLVRYFYGTTMRIASGLMWLRQPVRARRGA